MKKLVIIIALSLFLKPIIPVIEYALNYDYISKVLCVNKDQPMLHCNGKCHLIKQLAKESENEKPLSPTKKSNTPETEILFCMDVPTIEIPREFRISCFKINAHYVNLYDYSNLNGAFHPPTV